MGNPAMQAPTPAQMQKMADTQAAPLVEKLMADPTNAGLLASIGNIYYDTQQYPTAIDYYQRTLKVQPANAGVRTDMATAYWYSGDADTAIAEFQKSLSYEPNKANTLFNLGIVEWQGKMDIDKAVAAWQKLLDTNPNYEAKDKVLELMAQAKKHSGVKPGTPAKALPQ
jgi:cytochrome c-type biogenesis protein CcmH/NrfG